MSTWHADDRTLSTYANAPTGVDNVTAASIEAHLLRCEQCRVRLAAMADHAGLDDSWQAIVDVIDQPRRGPVERLLGWFVPDGVARVVAATAALRAAWLVAVTAVVAAAVAAARVADTDAPFVLLAPLVPLAGIAASFGAAPEPAGEAALAAPVHGAGLLLRRAAAVLASSGAILLAGTIALPDLDWRTIAWVLPAVGLTATALALSTWVSPSAATGAAGAVWVAVVQAAVILDGATGAVEESPLFGPPGQLAYLAVTGVTAIALNARRSHFRALEAR